MSLCCYGLLSLLLSLPDYPVTPVCHIEHCTWFLCLSLHIHDIWLFCLKKYDVTNSVTVSAPEWGSMSSQWSTPPAMTFCIWGWLHLLHSLTPWTVCTNLWTWTVILWWCGINFKWRPGTFHGFLEFSAFSHVTSWTKLPSSSLLQLDIQLGYCQVMVAASISSSVGLNFLQAWNPPSLVNCKVIILNPLFCVHLCARTLSSKS